MSKLKHKKNTHKMSNLNNHTKTKRKPKTNTHL